MVGIEIKRRFVEVGFGQFHLREAGSGGARPLVMLHGNPTSSRDLVPLIGRMASARRIVAPDTAGLGDSDMLAVTDPTIADYADATLAALDALKLETFDLYGSHTGANLAVEIALRRPHCVGRVVIDGIALYTPALRAALLANYAKPFTPSLDGEQFGRAFRFMRDQHLFWPWFEATPAGSRDLGLPDPSALHAQVLDVLKAASTYPAAYRASFLYPKEEMLPQLRVPCLVATSISDIFHPDLARAAALIPGAIAHTLPPYHATDYLKRAAATFLEFLDA